MCFSSLVLSRRPKISKKRPQTLKNPLTPIGPCRDLHIAHFPESEHALKSKSEGDQGALCLDPI